MIEGEIVGAIGVSGGHTARTWSARGRRSQRSAPRPPCSRFASTSAPVIPAQGAPNKPRLEAPMAKQSGAQYRTPFAAPCYVAEPSDSMSERSRSAMRC